MGLNLEGLLIVIDGTDGSGKATQTKILYDNLKTKGYDVELIDFPRYGHPSAFLVENYLNGNYGSVKDVDAKAASIFYAIDRFHFAREKLSNWLSEGKIIICNRYVSASMGHQAGKIKNLAERDQFLDWLDDLEYNIFKIPRPDKNILLYLPPGLGQENVDKKGHRDYLGGKKRDIHEADINHLKDASDAYLYCAKKFNWDVIDCAVDGIMLSKEFIAEKLFEKINPLLRKS